MWKETETRKPKKKEIREEKEAPDLGKILSRWDRT
jgi:hypothetical protein